MRARVVKGLAIVAMSACGGGSSAPSSAASDASAPPQDAAVAVDGAPIGDGAASDGASTDGAIAGTRVRIVAANLTSGTKQEYEQPGIDILKGLAPDVVLIQELAVAGGDLRAFVDGTFAPSFAFYVDPRTGGIPNGVISRWPIVAAGTWTDASVSDRAFVWAHVDVPGPIDLWAVSVHLLTTGATQRATEATQLAGYVQANVPAGDYLVIGGDFNTDATDEAALTDLGALVVVTPPYPADGAGNTNTSINRNRPHDWVLPGPSLAARATAVAIGAQSFASGLVFDSRVYTPLADVAPVVAGDSAASGMQHMAVVRDFALGDP